VASVDVPAIARKSGSKSLFELGGSLSWVNPADDRSAYRRAQGPGATREQRRSEVRTDRAELGGSVGREQCASGPLSLFCVTRINREVYLGSEEGPKQPSQARDLI
jgi:hypothetical protein